VEAIAAADEIEELCPQCPHVAKDRAWSLAATGDYAAAEAIADDLRRVPRYEVDGLVLKGHIESRVTGPEAGLAWLERAYEAAPEAHEANCHLAGVLARLERYSEALPYARRARATHPTEGRALGLYCMILAETGCRDELLAVVAEAWKRTWPVSAEAGVGHALWRVDGAQKLALAWSKRVLKRDPKRVDGLCLAGRASAHVGQKRSALRYFERLKRADPVHHGSLAFLQMARIHVELDEWRSALETMILARTELPSDKEVEEYLGYTIEGLVGTLEEKTGESEKWRERFEAVNREHSSLREAIREMHSAAEPGIPVGVAIVEGEGQTVEFMAKYPENARDLAKEIAAFSTSNDGNIYLGIANDGEVIGLKGLDTAEARDSFLNRVGGLASGTVNPPARVSVCFMACDDKTVARVFVWKGTQSIYYVGNIPYLRDLDRSRPAQPHEVEQLIRRSQATRR
jgi:tetratricopeptide (TPR) repeat protein